MLNAGLGGACTHCPKPQLLDANRKLTGVHFWEDYNPVTERWYTIQSMAINWLDGRWAIMELATDITTRKQVELELIEAKEKAEESGQAQIGIPCQYESRNTYSSQRYRRLFESACRNR